MIEISMSCSGVTPATSFAVVAGYHNGVRLRANVPRLGVRKRLVMTGGTSGIGRRVVERLLIEQPQWTIVILARPSPRADELQASSHPKRLTLIDTDLASLSSTDRACDEVLRRLDLQGIDALALNAGVQIVSDNASSVDGIELSFAVNFLAHFLIVERLKWHMRTAGRIVTTSSEVHDLDAFCLMGIGRARWQDPIALADPVRSQDHIASIVDRGEARYCASKLLNIMHARHLAHELPTIGVVAFNPSVVPGTKIARDRNWLQRLGWRHVMPPFAPILPGARSLEHSSSDLLWLLTEADVQSMSGNYVDGREVQSGSKESRDWVKIARAMEVGRTLISKRLHANEFAPTQD